jgi:hypothetical protein
MPDSIPTQIAEIKKDVGYLRKELDREMLEQRENRIEEKSFRSEVRRRLVALENASLGIAAVAASGDTKRNRVAFAAVLLFGFVGMIVGVLSVVLR